MAAVFVCGVRARPKNMMKIPIPTANARRGSISSYLDRDHATDDQIADEDHEDTDGDQYPADDAFEHRTEVGRGDEIHECREHDRKKGDQRARGTGLRGQSRDLAFDSDALANRVGDVVED